MASLVPRITFRVESISEPFDGMSKIEVRFGVIVRLSDTEIASVLQTLMPVHRARMLAVGDTWDSTFTKRQGAAS